MISYAHSNRTRVLLLGVYQDTCGVRAIHPQPERRGFSRIPVNASSSQPLVALQVINGISVPPEPDPVVNNSTLLGVDSNNNGVRDDVERRIAVTYGANAAHYEGALRIAKSDQGFLVANGDRDKSTAATFAAAKAGLCMYAKLGNDGIATNKAIDRVSPFTFNTTERMAAYRATSVASTEVDTPIPANPCQ